MELITARKLFDIDNGIEYDYTLYQMDTLQQLYTKHQRIFLAAKDEAIHKHKRFKAIINPDEYHEIVFLLYSLGFDFGVCQTYRSEIGVVTAYEIDISWFGWFDR
jgi:hypothetical protein